MEQHSFSEKKHLAPIDTVRTLVVSKTGRVLMLKKGLKSSRAGLFEFPGGQVEVNPKMQSLIHLYQMNAARELFEETEGSFSPAAFIPVEHYPVTFERLNTETGVMEVHQRRVHSFKLVGVDEYEPKVNNDEDKHAEGKWMTVEELQELYDQDKLIDTSRLASQVASQALQLLGIKLLDKTE